jgi:hypothetical protein
MPEATYINDQLSPRTGNVSSSKEREGKGIRVKKEKREQRRSRSRSVAVLWGLLRAKVL